MGLLIFYKQYRKYFQSPYAVEINLSQRTIRIANTEYNLNDIHTLQMVQSCVDPIQAEITKCSTFYGLVAETNQGTWELIFKTYTPSQTLLTEFGQIFSEILSVLRHDRIEFAKEVRDDVRFCSPVEYRVSRNYRISS